MFDWLCQRPALEVYAFLILSAGLESLFPPHPADIFILLFAFLAGRGVFDPRLVYLATVGGSIAGIMALHALASVYGTALVDRAGRSGLRWLLPSRLVERLRGRFQRHGIPLLLLHRFMPGMRAPIIFTAGLARARPAAVFGLGLASVALWDLFLVAAAFRVGQTWDSASAFLRRYNYLALAVLAVLLTAGSLYFFLRQKKT
jgi:membrane protein DedA with SNARE-associated domain